MKVQVLKNFPYSTNGIDQHQAVKGEDPDPAIPEEHIDGLVAEGFIKVAGRKAPEAKIEEPIVPDEEVDVEDLEGDELRERYKEVFGRAPHHSWDDDTIRDKILEEEEE